MSIKKWFKSKPYWLKGVLLALCIWIILFGLLQISDNIIKANCYGPGELPPPGSTCYNDLEYVITGLFAFSGFPIILPIGGSPSLSTVGPIGVQKFFIGSAISFALWGILIAWIIRKIKARKAK